MSENNAQNEETIKFDRAELRSNPSASNFAGNKAENKPDSKAPSKTENEAANKVENKTADFAVENTGNTRIAAVPKTAEWPADGM